MVNCNPETVSTDYDTSDRLFFEPLTNEDVLNVCERLQEAGDVRGVIVSLGGQTPLKLAHDARSAAASRCSARARRRSTRPRTASSSTRCATGSASRSPTAAIGDRAPTTRVAVANDDRLPGARAPVVRARRPRDADRLRRRRPAPRDGRARRTPARSAAKAGCRPNGPRSIDRFLEDAIEVDVDALRDRTGEVRHRRRDGAHRGSRRALGRLRVRDPAADALGRRRAARSSSYTRALADALDVVGLLNVQYAVKDERVYVIEANPRASRTVPFVSKATGVPLAKVAARVMVGATLRRARAPKACCARPPRAATSR